MEDKHQKLPLFFSKFSGSIRERTDNDLNIRCFTKKQMKSITENYNTVLGKGGFSVVYKGKLDDGRPVAVKKYIFATKKKEFTKEVIIQSQFSHRNIVRLLGCCVEADAPMLVTEFVPNGNLSDLLHASTPQRVPLSLSARLQIASDVAEALVYMHTSQSHPILHGDIKPENIFLDNNYVSKLSDFGISRLLSMNSDEYTGYVIGSMGYVDPVFCQTGRLTTKSDVYSFGIVLMELVTRKKAIDDNNNFIAKTFTHMNTKINSHENLDAEIATAENMEVLDCIVNLALGCIKFEVEERPDMREVSECLRKLQTDEMKCLQEMICSLQQSGFKRLIRKDNINKMTDNFKIIPTEHFMGKIYRCESEKMLPVEIIKMSFQVHSGVSQEFCRQMILQSKIYNENVVSFLGCCFDGGGPILVYESAKVSLHDILFGDVRNKRINDFKQRLQAALSIVKGLDYLHSLGIVHGDVRTANMLVTDLDFSEKGFYRSIPIRVSGIGASLYLSMSKPAHERIKREKNNGYMDPRSLEVGILTKEADVYSLGVVLLELFTGKMVSNHIRDCRIEEIWDEDVCCHIENTRSVIFRCLDPDVVKRPTLYEMITCFEVDLARLVCARVEDSCCNGFCAARVLPPI